MLKNKVRKGKPPKKMVFFFSAGPLNVEMCPYDPTGHYFWYNSTNTTTTTTTTTTTLSTLFVTNITLSLSELSVENYLDLI